MDTAVAARASTFSARVSPDELALHVAAALRRWITDEGRECVFPEPEWPTLSLGPDPGRPENPGPQIPRLWPASQTADWEAATGRSIPGETCARQIGVVQRWYDADQRNPADVRRLAFGTARPAGLETAVGAKTTDEDWEQRLSEALTQLHDCRWPLDYLRTNASVPASGAGR